MGRPYCSESCEYDARTTRAYRRAYGVLAERRRGAAYERRARAVARRAGVCVVCAERVVRP